MSIDAHERYSEAIRSLHISWSQNPEDILNERPQTIGLNSDYLKIEPALFELFRQKLYKKLNRYYYELVDLIDSENFAWQIKIMWTVLKTNQSKKLNYEQIRKAIRRPKLEEVQGVHKVSLEFKKIIKK